MTGILERKQAIQALEKVDHFVLSNRDMMTITSHSETHPYVTCLEQHTVTKATALLLYPAPFSQSVRQWQCNFLFNHLIMVSYSDGKVFGI